MTDTDTRVDGSPVTARPTNRRQQVRAAWADFRKSIVWKALAAQQPWFYGLLGISLLYGGSLVLIVKTISSIFDDAIVARTKPIDPLIGRLLIFTAGIFVWGLIARLLTSRIVYQMEFDLRCWLYDRLQDIAPDALDGLSAGQLVTRALTDLGVLELFTVALPAVIGGLILVGLLAAYMVIVDPLMGFVALVTIPINAVIVSRMAQRMWGLSWLGLSTRAVVTATIDEPVRGIRVVKAFGAEDHARQKVKDASDQAYGVAIARVRLLARFGIPTRVLPIVANAALLYLGARAAVAGRFTIGNIVIYLAFGAVFTGIASAVDEILSVTLFATTGSTRIFELANLPSQAAATGDRLLPDERGAGLVAGAIETPTGPDPVDVAIPPGRWLALTGPPGCGSSALAAALAGLAPVVSGRVTIDGVSLAEIDPAARRTAVKHVGSEPFLFGRSVRENLTVGLQDAPPSDSRLRAALEAAGAAEFVDDMDGGLEATLGDRGLTLSGGQRQRLALARAIVGEPRLLVLDEALSAVNPSLEVDILGRVRAFLPSTSVVVVSRRPGPLAAADQVLELPARPPLLGRDDIAAGVRMFDDPGDPRLVAAIEAAGHATDRPPVLEAEAIDQRVPTVANMVKPLLGLAAVGVITLIVSTVASYAPDALAASTVNGIRIKSRTPGNHAALLVLGLAVIVPLFIYVQRIVFRKVNEAVLYLLRRRTFNRLSHLGVDYYDRELPGQVASRVVYDLDKITEFIDGGIYPLITSIALLVTAMPLLWIVSHRVFFNVLPFIPVMVILTVIEIPLAGRAYVLVRDKLGRVVARFHEDFIGRSVIASFGGQDDARRGFAELSWELRQARRWATGVSNVYLAFIEGLTFLATTVLIGIAGHQSISGVISVGSVVFLELLLFRALAPIPTLSAVLQTYLTARASFAQLGQPFRAEVLPLVKPNAGDCPALSGEITLHDITFAYPGTERRALVDVSLHVAPGEMLALVGPTGAGKSSVAKVLSRVYDPDAGAVLVDGLDIRDFDLISYRRRLGVVPQDAFCFRGTVASNIAFGRPDASHDEISAAIEATGVQGIVLALPQGLDTLVDEEGRNLSPVARQAIAIARAWLVEPDVLVLDEATSSLPDAIERDVLEAVRRFRRTAIVVTHRLSVASHVDRIAVLQAGRVVEIGTHDELMRTGGAYAHLWAHGADGALAGAGAAPVAGRRRRTAARK